MEKKQTGEAEAGSCLVKPDKGSKMGRYTKMGLDGDRKGRPCEKKTRWIGVWVIDTRNDVVEANTSR